MCAAGSIAAVYAQDEPDSGNLHVTIHDQDKPIGGGKVTIYSVDDLEKELADELEYEFGDNALISGSSEVSSDSSGSSDGSDSESGSEEETAAKLEDLVEEHHVSGTTEDVPDSGTVDFMNIPLGDYLVVDTEAAKGYEKFEPFVISIPTDSDEGDGMTYDVKAFPKTSAAVTGGGDDDDEKPSDTDKDKDKDQDQDTNTGGTSSGGTSSGGSGTNAATGGNSSGGINYNTGDTGSNTNSSGTNGNTNASTAPSENPVNTSPAGTSTLTDGLFLLGVMILSALFLILIRQRKHDI